MDALTPLRLAARLRARRTLAPDATPRPEGAVLWIHAGNAAPVDMAPLASLAARLTDAVGQMSVVATGIALESPPQCVHAVDLQDDAVSLRRFLDHWRPGAALWLDGCEPPLALDAAARAGVPLVLANARAPAPSTGRARRIKRLLYGRFHNILARDTAAAEALRALVPSRTPVEATGPLTPLTEPLACADSDHAEFASILGSRPVWFAVQPARDELTAVLEAHAMARRSAHRLLLLLAPGQNESGADLAFRLMADGWSVARRGADEMPHESTEVYVADSPEEMGLWYRLSPFCFLGGTLADGAAVGPQDAAALGSALIVGPEGGAESATLERFDGAGALRRIGRADGLARAVVELLSPDRTALLAHRAWEVATDGAEVEQRLVGLLSVLMAEQT